MSAIEDIIAQLEEMQRNEEYVKAEISRGLESKRDDAEHDVLVNLAAHFNVEWVGIDEEPTAVPDEPEHPAIPHWNELTIVQRDVLEGLDGVYAPSRWVKLDDDGSVVHYHGIIDETHTLSVHITPGGKHLDGLIITRTESETP